MQTILKIIYGLLVEFDKTNNKLSFLAKLNHVRKHISDDVLLKNYSDKNGFYKLPDFDDFTNIKKLYNGWLLLFSRKLNTQSATEFIEQFPNSLPSKSDAASYVNSEPLYYMENYRVGDSDYYITDYPKELLKLSNELENSYIKLLTIYLTDGNRYF